VLSNGATDFVPVLLAVEEIPNLIQYHDIGSNTPFTLELGAVFELGLQHDDNFI
jgi:hypothetical protein